MAERIASPALFVAAPVTARLGRRSAATRSGAGQRLRVMAVAGAAEPGVPAALARRAVLSLGALATLSACTPASAGPGDVTGPYCDFTQTLPCDPYPSYVATPSGLLYQDLRFGEGEAVRPGEEVAVDWDGYTFYLQHVIKARNLPKGGDFAGDEESAFLRFVVGEGKVIQAFEEAVSDMKVGGIRRVIVHPGALSYPGILSKQGGSWKQVGPEPQTLSGRRALEFVLRNTANVDKSLLFDIEVLGVGEGARARRGPGTWSEAVKNKVV
eukprot:jgi/Tetstr1/463812/TSEL_008626.t1